MSSPLQNTGPFTVRPGSPQMLLAQMPAGTLIVNNDATNGVWLSDQPGLTPGSGFNVGPLGSVTWQTLGPCYACVDTGVTVPVGLTVGTAATNPDNPVAVGAAVAAQLLLTGVPNVLIQDTIYNDVIGHVFPNTSVMLTVSKYASVTIKTGLGNCVYQFLDEQNNVLDTDNLIVALPGGIARSTRLEVIAPYLLITNTSTFDAFVNVIGSNRQALVRYDSRFMNAVPDYWSYAAATAAGETVEPNHNGESQLQGLCYMTLQLAAGTQGRLNITDVASGATRIFADTLIDCAPGTFSSLYGSKLVALPAATYKFQFINKTAIGNLGLAMTFIPANI